MAGECYNTKVERKNFTNKLIILNRKVESMNLS